MFEQLDKFESKPYRKITFSDAVKLFHEVGSIASEIRLNWFIKNHFNVTNSEKLDAFSWIERLQDKLEIVGESMPLSSVIDHLSDDLDDINDYLIERAND